MVSRSQIHNNELTVGVNHYAQHQLTVANTVFQGDKPETNHGENT